MAEYSENTFQTVPANQNVVFTNAPDPCEKGLIIHRDGSGIFTLKGIVPNNYTQCNCKCNQNNRVARYMVTFGANVQIPTGGTVEEISLGLAVDGEVLPDSIVRITPAAVEQFQNVSRTVSVPVPRGCCENVAIENISTQAVGVQEANIVFSRPDLYVTR